MLSRGRVASWWVSSFVARVVAVVLFLGLMAGLACAPDATPPATPPTGPATIVASPTLPRSPSPVAALSPSPVVSPSPATSIAPVVSPPPALTPSPPPPVETPSPPVVSPLPTLSPVPTVAVPRTAVAAISNNRTIQDFPNKITFSIEGTSAENVQSVFLEYGTSKRSISSEITRVQPPHGASKQINTSYSWEMKKTGSIPPGTRIWWQWRVTDSAGGAFVTPQQSVYWEDSQFSWRQWTSADMNIYYLNQSTTLMRDLTAGLESNVARVKLKVTIPDERRPRIYVYNDSQEIRGAVLFTQEWTGALAYPDYNIILTAVSASNLEWAKTTLAHEVTHLRVGELVFGPFGRLPTWLNEGLAKFAEGEIGSGDRDILNKAAKDGNLISVRSLASNFSADASRAHLAYTESHSLVSYLIANYGWDKMQDLLAVFKDGSTYDNALKKVYGFDADGLEKAWKSRLGAP